MPPTTSDPVATTEPVPVDMASPCQVTDIPASLGLDSFYTQYCSYQGIPIISSGNVPPAALQVAWAIMDTMLQGHPDVVASLVNQNVRIGIAGQHEGITDLPEYNFLKNDPNMDWDARSRGFGATSAVPLGSGTEENLLCYTNDRYRGESIFVHEFAHTMKDMGLALINRSFDNRLLSIYNQAMLEGLWVNTYAATNIHEYWAEGVQSYFNTNLEAIPAQGIHNHVNTRAELAEYDPRLYGMIDGVFKGLEWTPSCP